MDTNGKLYISGPYNESLINEITAGFSKKLGRALNFSVEEDDTLIGGFRAIIDGKLYDASVLSKTEQILRHLINND